LVSAALNRIRIVRGEMLPKRERRKRRRELNRKNFPSEKYFEKLLGLWKVPTLYQRNFCLVGTFFGDFVWVHHKLVVEIDGSSHENKASYDAWRDEKIKKGGWRIYRLNYPFVESEIAEFKRLFLPIITKGSPSRKRNKDWRHCKHQQMKREARDEELFRREKKRVLGNQKIKKVQANLAALAAQPYRRPKDP
jgi:very-short-patch-repair endonuclease